MRYFLGHFSISLAKNFFGLGYFFTKFKLCLPSLGYFTKQQEHQDFDDDDEGKFVFSVKPNIPAKLREMHLLIFKGKLRSERHRSLIAKNHPSPYPLHLTQAVS